MVIQTVTASLATPGITEIGITAGYIGARRFITGAKVTLSDAWIGTSVLKKEMDQCHEAERMFAKGFGHWNDMCNGDVAMIYIMDLPLRAEGFDAHPRCMKEKCRRKRVRRLRSRLHPLSLVLCMIAAPKPPDELPGLSCWAAWRSWGELCNHLLIRIPIAMGNFQNFAVRHSWWESKPEQQLGFFPCRLLLGREACSTLSVR